MGGGGTHGDMMGDTDGHGETGMVTWGGHRRGDRHKGTGIFMGTWEDMDSPQGCGYMCGDTQVG